MSIVDENCPLLIQDRFLSRGRWDASTGEDEGFHSPKFGVRIRVSYDSSVPTIKRPFLNDPRLSLLKLLSRLQKHPVKDGQFVGRRIPSMMQRSQDGIVGNSSDVDQQVVAEEHTMQSSEPEVGERGMVGKLESVYRVSTSPLRGEEVETPHLEDVGEEVDEQISSSDSPEVYKKFRKKKGIRVPFSKVSLVGLNFWHHFFVHPGADRLHKTLLQRGIRVKMQDCQHVCDACEACSTCKRMYPGAWQHQEPEEEEIEAKINDKVSVDLLYLIRTRKFKVYALVFQDVMSGIVESVMVTNKDPKGVK